MAESAVPFGSIDVLDLESITTNWIAQGDTLTESTTYSNTAGKNGDVDCESAGFGTIESGTVNYKYCDSGSNDFGTQLKAILLGEVRNTYIITQIEVSTSNGAEPEVTFTVHKHIDGENHTAAGVTNERWEMPAWMETALNGVSGDVGAVDPFGKESADVDCQNSTITLTCQHNDVADADGNNSVGTNYEGGLTGKADYVGTITSGSLANSFVQDDRGKTRANQEHENGSISGHQWLTRYVPGP
jgi:hypothetical protein